VFLFYVFFKHFKELDSELSHLEVKTQSDFTELRMVPARQQCLNYGKKIYKNRHVTVKANG